MRRLRLTVGLVGLLAVMPATSAAQNARRVCWPAVHLPAVHLAAVRLPAVRLPTVRLPKTQLPAVRLPRTCFAGSCTPARTVPARVIPGRTIPGRTIPGRTIPARTIPARDLPARCFSTASAWAPAKTTVRVADYGAIDRSFSPKLSADLWNTAPSAVLPDVTAPGFGERNAAGFPRNQYVRPYVRSDGTFVSGYWRNSPADGLPTCRIISC